MSLLSKHLNHYRCLLNYVLQALVNKSVNMVKQLYYSQLHLKNIKIYLSKLYIGMYSEVHYVMQQGASNKEKLPMRFKIFGFTDF